jgi:hypothetical protein
VSTPKGHLLKKHSLLDRRQQQDQAAEDETGKISVYLDLADKAFDSDEVERTEEVA